MSTAILQTIGILIALGSAVYASRQANSAKEQAKYAKEQADSAREQADCAKDANKILQVEMKRKIIDACVEQHSHKGEWETYLNSVPDLSDTAREEINQSVRMRLGKV